MEFVHSGYNLIIAIYAVKKQTNNLWRTLKKKKKILSHIIVDGVFR